MKNDKTDFTQGSIPKKLALFMLPILGSLVLQAAYGAVDLLVVGRFGSTSGLSAVSTGSLNPSRSSPKAAAGRSCWCWPWRSSAARRLYSPFWPLCCSGFWCFWHGPFPA